MPKKLISVEYTVLIEAPAGEVYQRWNRVEDYPSFMEGVLEIRWLNEKRFSLKSEAGGMIFDSVCELTVKIPNRRLAWRTLSGPDSSGVVTFNSTKQGIEVTLKMLYNPQGGWQDQNQVRERLKRNLERFRTLVEGDR